MKRHSERGYNLVELLVAIALLGVVLMSVLSLFVWGRRNVYSGKQMTTAVAVGTRVLEDLAPLTKADIYSGVFEILDTDAGQTIKFGQPLVTYTNAALRSTDATIVTGYADIQKQKATGPKLLDKWTTELGTKLGNGAAVTLLMLPRDNVNAPKFGTAPVMQLRVVVSWNENARRREVVLESVKAQ